MSRPIEQALTTIIPRHPGPLPTDLLDLARSLLSQSHNKCSNLKPDEEIARTYLCAHIACERLKTTLNLPQIENRPPIPPRSYTKLYKYFETTLTPTLRSKKSKQNLPSSAPTTPNKRPVPKNPTPSSKPISRPSFQPNRTPKAQLKHKSNVEKALNIPPWLAPVIRLLCSDLETPKAIPHILAGVESILNLPEEENKVAERKIPALVAAVWFFVVVKMRRREEKGMESSERKRLVRESIARAREDEGVLKRVGDKEGDWKGWVKFEERDVGVWRKDIVDVEKGWKGMDWYTNIEDGVGVDGDEDEGEEEEEQDEIMDEVLEEREDSRKKKGRWDKYDYLNEERKRDYREWEITILKQIAALEAEVGLGGDEMDETEG